MADNKLKPLQKQLLDHLRSGRAVKVHYKYSSVGCYGFPRPPGKMPTHKWVDVLMELCKMGLAKDVHDTGENASGYNNIVTFAASPNGSAVEEGR